MKNKILQLFVLMLIISSCTYDYLEQPTKVRTLRLSTDNLLLPSDGTVSIVEILNGEGGYSVSSKDEETATVKMVGKEVHITPIKEGKTDIVVTDKETGNKAEVTLDIIAIDFAEKILVEGGDYTFGTKKITISNFYIAKYEVTVKEFCAFLNDANNGYSTSKTDGVLTPSIKPLGIKYKIENSLIVYFPEEGQSNFPMVDIDWNEARKYCAWKGGRLPSDTEWEYAAQGGKEGTGGNTEMINNFIDTIAWWENNRNGYNELHDVQSKKPNKLGIYNMIGNAAEWCQDNFSGEKPYNYADSDPNKYAHIPLDGTAYIDPTSAMRIVRGGSTGYCEVKNTIHKSKMSLRQGYFTAANGFRVAYDTL